MKINEIQDQVIEEFSSFADWLDRYDYLIQIGNELKPIDPAYRNDEYIINGCQSKVWLHADYKDGRVVFEADSDALIVKGIVALLVRILSDQPASDIMNCDLYFIDRIGLKENLSPTRSNGLLAMIKKMKLYGMAYHAKHSGV